MDSMAVTKERSYLSVFNDPRKKAQNKNTAAAGCKSNIWTQPLQFQNHPVGTHTRDAS